MRERVRHFSGNISVESDSSGVVQVTMLIPRRRYSVTKIPDGRCKRRSGNCDLSKPPQPGPRSCGLVERPEDIGTWSSFRHYATGEIGVVEIESQWAARMRERAGIFPTVKIRAWLKSLPSEAWTGHPQEWRTSLERTSPRLLLYDLDPAIERAPIRRVVRGHRSVRPVAKRLQAVRRYRVLCGQFMHHSGRAQPREIHIPG